MKKSDKEAAQYIIDSLAPMLEGQKDLKIAMVIVAGEQHKPKKNMVYTNLNLAAMRGVDDDTMRAHIKKLVEDKKFEKTSPGKTYSETEAKKLAEIMGFTLTR